MRRAYEALVVRVFGAWDDEPIAADFAAKWGAGGFEIVEERGVPVGAVWVTDEGPYVRLREIFLLPEAQGRGIGTALIRAEIDAARRRGRPLRLRVLRANRARELYRRLGFVEREAEGEKVWMETT